MQVATRTAPSAGAPADIETAAATGRPAPKTAPTRPPTASAGICGTPFTAKAVAIATIVAVCCCAVALGAGLGLGLATSQPEPKFYVVQGDPDKVEGKTRRYQGAECL